MQPDSLSNKPTMDLPPVAPLEQKPANNEVQQSVVIQQGTERNPELLTAAVPQSGLPPAKSAPTAPSNGGMPSGASPVGSVPIAPTTSSSMPVMADDAELIEKEWVEKAKEIVNRTKDDPYVQNKEINKMKADYVKKRYSKDILLSEE